MSETKALAPMEAFTERLKTKLRDDIGSMLPDEVIAGMVQKVINEEFFTKRTVRNNPNNWGDTSTRLEPTVFQNIVMEAVKPIIEQHAKRVLAENASIIDAQIAEIVDQGFSKMIMRAIDATMRDALANHEWKIQGILQSLVSRNA